MTYKDKMLKYLEECNRLAGNIDRLLRRNDMNHFIDWKFGVPVKVHAKPVQANVSIKVRLINEASHSFTVVDKHGQCVIYNKEFCYYELIPYAIKSRCSPRYPICENNEYTAFCNSSGIMTELDRSGGDFKPKRRHVAKFVLEDGTEIKLSDETTANLRKELGV